MRRADLVLTLFGRCLEVDVVLWIVHKIHREQVRLDDRCESFFVFMHQVAVGVVAEEFIEERSGPIELEFGAKCDAALEGRLGAVWFDSAARLRDLQCRNDVPEPLRLKAGWQVERLELLL